jgi:hypothetical protein
MYLFQWLSSTEKSIAEAPMVRPRYIISRWTRLTSEMQEHLKSKQANLEASLVKVVLAQEPYPIPGRALRNCVARCFIALYTRAETRTLFDTLQAFIKVIIDFKTPDRDSHKMCVILCLLFPHLSTMQRGFLSYRGFNESFWIAGAVHLHCYARF